jgi:acyl carrier protein
MVSELEVKNLLKNEISSRMDLPVDSIDENVHLADLGIDSLQALQLLVVLERSFGIALNDDDLQYFRDIKTLASLVASRVQEAAAGAAH